MMSILSVDFHSHILPGIDDGCPTVDEAIKMLQMECEQGVNKIFLTPHFNAHVDFPDVFIKNRSKSFDELKLAVGGLAEFPELLLGAEVRFCPGMSSWEQLPELALENTGYILIEMPNSNWAEETFLELERIYKQQNLVPILAHIERYFIPLKTRSMLRRLKTLPVLLQANCDFIIERKTQSFAQRLLKKDFINLIGSDCHSADWRAPNMKQARKQIIGFADEALINRIYNYEQVITKSK